MNKNENYLWFYKLSSHCYCLVSAILTQRKKLWKNTKKCLLLCFRAYANIMTGYKSLSMERAELKVCILESLADRGNRRHWQMSSQRHSLQHFCNGKCWKSYDKVLYSALTLLIVLVKYYIVSNGEGNGTPLQYSCLENPMDRGAWWAAVHGVAKSWKWLSDWTELNWTERLFKH